MVTVGSQRKKVTKTSFAERGVKVGAKSVAEAESITDVTSAVCGELQLEAKLTFPFSALAVRKY